MTKLETCSICLIEIKRGYIDYIQTGHQRQREPDNTIGGGRSLFCGECFDEIINKMLSMISQKDKERKAQDKK